MSVSDGGENTLIFVLPGGGYENHAPHEAEPVADWIRALGHEARILRYPLAPVRMPAAFDLVRTEIREARATHRGRIGVIGFSAGGHLAGHVAFAATDDPAEVPDFAVLGYPVVALGEGGHIGSRDNLLGERTDLAESVSLQNLVTGDSPPTFVWHTVDDEVVPVSHSLRLASALAAAAVPFELHIFPSGVHGLGLAQDSSVVKQWTVLCARWLEGAGRY